MINNYDDLISRYIEDDLNKDETASFEKYMNSNKDFLKKVDKIKNNISLYQNLPKKETSKDFLTILILKLIIITKINFGGFQILKRPYHLYFPLLFCFS